MKAKGANSKIVMTGGHAGSTAQAIIEQIRKTKKPWEVYWIGAKYAFEGSKAATFETRVFPKLGVKVYGIRAGRLQRKWSVYTVPSLLKIPAGLWQSVGILRRIRPGVVLSYGGFASFPVVLSGYILRIKIVVHEQTAVVGLANRMASKFASEIAISRSSSLEYLPKGKTVLVGNPLRQEIIKSKPKDKISRPPVVLVTGGSRGAMAINEMVEKELHRMLERFIVIHLTGELEHSKFIDIASLLPDGLRTRYEVCEFLNSHEFAKQISRADVVVSRSGANTVSELIYLRKRMVLIPIPWTRYDEQSKNAELAKENGTAVVLSQTDYKQGELTLGIEKVIKMKKAGNSRIAKLDQLASARMVEILGKYA